MVPTAATALATLWQATLGVASGSVTAAQFSASYGAILGVYSTSGTSASSFTAFFGALTAFIFDQGPLRGVGLSQTERLSLIMGNSASANLRSDGTTTTNGGVFVRRTIDEILLGYVASDPLTAITGKGYNGTNQLATLYVIVAYIV